MNADSASLVACGRLLRVCRWERAEERWRIISTAYAKLVTDGENKREVYRDS